MKSLMFAVALAVLSTGAAAASDLKDGTTDTRDPFTFPKGTVSWTGVYAGVSGGMDFANTSTGYDGELPLSHSNRSISVGGNLDGIGSTGFIGEGQIGYRYQAGKVVFGVFGGGNISNTKTTLDAYFGRMELIKAELTRDWGWFAGPSIGYAFSPDTLFYAAGGYTQADFSLKGGFGRNSVDETETFNGYFGEVGVETRLSGAVFGKVFGRYVDYDSKSYDDDKLTIDPSELQAMVGIVIKTR